MHGEGHLAEWRGMRVVRYPVLCVGFRFEDVVGDVSHAYPDVQLRRFSNSLGDWTFDVFYAVWM